MFESITTTIKLISSGDAPITPDAGGASSYINNTTSASTGDSLWFFIFVLFTLIAFCLVAKKLFLLKKSGISADSSMANSQNESMHKKSIIAILSLVLLSLVFCISVTLSTQTAIANNNHVIDTPTSVNAVYDKNTHKINIDKTHFNVNSDKNLYISYVEAKAVDDIDLSPSVWNIKIDNKSVYDGKVPGSLQQHININKENILEYSIKDFDENKIEQLINKDIATITFNIDEEVAPVLEYSVNFETDGNGTIDDGKSFKTKENWTYELNENNQLIFKDANKEQKSCETAVPNESFIFDYWTVNNEKIESKSPVAINQDCKFKAYFKKDVERISLSGKVVDYGDIPVVGMNVRLFEYAPEENKTNVNHLLAETITDENGIFTLNNIEKGVSAYITYESGDDADGLVCESAEVDTSQSQTDITPSKPSKKCIVKGKITDIHGQPQSNVYVTYGTSNNQRYYDSYYMTETDENGNYRLATQARDFGYYYIEKTNYFTPSFTYINLLPGQIYNQDEVICLEDDAVTITGKVTDKEGKPSQSSIFFYPENYTSIFTMPQYNVGSDEDGNYTIKCYPGTKGDFNVSSVQNPRYTNSLSISSETKQTIILNIELVPTQVKINLNGGSIQDADIPWYWEKSLETDQEYFSTYAKGSGINTIVSTWDINKIKPPSEKATFDKWKWNHESQTLDKDTLITANWNIEKTAKAILTKDEHGNDDELIFYYDDKDHKKDPGYWESYNVINTRWADNVEDPIYPEWWDIDYTKCASPKTVVFDKSFADYKELTSLSYWFYNMYYLEEIIGIDNLYTDNVTEMGETFRECHNLENPNFSKWNTQNVDNFYGMFINCVNMNTVNLGGKFTTEKATNLSRFFEDCRNLYDVDLTQIKTNNCTSIKNMFKNCHGITKLDLSSFNTEKLTNMEGVFYGCTNLTSINITGLNTENVSNMADLFNRCENLETVDVSSLNTSNVETLNSIFYKCTKLKDINLSNFDTKNVKDFSFLFTYCENLNNIDISNFDTSNAERTNAMFMYCKSVKQIKLYTTESPNNKTTYQMFYGCASLTELDLSYFTTDTVENMSYMFYGCSALKELNLNSFITDNAKDMSFMFYDCKSLGALDLSEFDTSSVTNMHSMFSNCIGFAKLDLSNFNTINVTDMSQMFYGCTGLQEVNLTSFDTQNVESMDHMFHNCISLDNLDLSNKDAKKVVNTQFMFSSCSAMKNLNMENFVTESVEDMYEMFSKMTLLETINLSSFNTKNGIDMRYIFSGDTSLKSADVSGFEIYSDTKTAGMFSGCSALNDFTIGSKWVITMNNCGISHPKWKNEAGSEFSPSQIPSKESGFGKFTKVA